MADDKTKYELVKFTDNDFELEVSVSPEEETVWLTQENLTQLFDTTKQNISLHISNILKENELPQSTVKYSFTVQNEGGRQVKRKVKIYNLDMIISVGYRVKSQRGIIFRQWATKIIRDYLLKGYSNKFHDRFLIIDKSELYSIGVSIKDAGRKTFAINKMNNENIINALLLEIKGL